MDKSAIRKQMKNLRNQLPKEQQLLKSVSISDQLFQMEEYLNCDVILSFVSIKSEVQTHSIIVESIKYGKKVFVPKVEGKEIQFYQINGMGDLKPGCMGILEPTGEKKNQFDIKNYKAGSKFLILLPGLAFDFSGNRIGYGAGYYDRYLASNHLNFTKVALAYDFQVLKHMDAELYDIRADKIITESRCIVCNTKDIIITFDFGGLKKFRNI